MTTYVLIDGVPRRVLEEGPAAESFVDRVTTSVYARGMPYIDAPSWVYFVRIGRYVKIGWSLQPVLRFRSLNLRELLHPEDLIADQTKELVAIVPGDARTERAFHTVFAQYRARGEFFREEGLLAEFLVDGGQSRFVDVDLLLGDGESLADAIVDF